MNSRGNLWDGFLHSQIFRERLEVYAEAVQEKAATSSDCIGFIDGTVIGIARPKGSMQQRVVYNGHKRKHTLKYQAITSPNGLIVHAHGQIEGRRHDWTMYVRSGLEQIRPEVSDVGGKRYCLYGDSGYNWRWFLDVPFEGTMLT